MVGAYNMRVLSRITPVVTAQVSGRLCEFWAPVLANR